MAQKSRGAKPTGFGHSRVRGVTHVTRPKRLKEYGSMIAAIKGGQRLIDIVVERHVGFCIAPV